MRLLLGLLTLSLSSSSLACPNFAGSWSCTDSEGETYDSYVTQEMQNGVTVYYQDDGTDTMQIITDNSWHSMEDEDLEFARYRASCDGGTVNFYMEGLLPPEEDFPGGNITSNTQVSLDSQGRMVSNSNTYFNGDLMASTSEVCYRQ